MIITNSLKIAEAAKMMRNYGQMNRYQHAIKGLNSRLDELQAAVLRVKLKYLDEWNKKRRNLADLYNKRLNFLKEIELPKEMPSNYHVYHLYVVRTSKREELQKYLEKNGIISLIHYPLTIYQQRAYQDLKLGENTCPIAERYTDQILSLPLYPELAKRDIEKICFFINKFFKK